MRSNVKCTHKNVCECRTSKEMSKVKCELAKAMGEMVLRMWRKEVRS